MCVCMHQTLAGTCERCEPDGEFVGGTWPSLGFDHDSNSWEPFDVGLVTLGEREDFSWFRQTGVYVHMSTGKAFQDLCGVFMTTERVRVNIGSLREQVIQSYLAAQELGCVERLDELFAGTTSKFTRRLTLFRSEWYKKLVMVVELSTFLCGLVETRVYAGLPSHDPLRWRRRAGYVGRLVKSMHGKCDARKTVQNDVRTTLSNLGFRCIASQPRVAVHVSKRTVVCGRSSW